MGKIIILLSLALILSVTSIAQTTDQTIPSPVDAACSEVEKQVDDFTGEIFFSYYPATSMNGYKMTVLIIKTINKAKKASYSLFLYAYGNYIEYDGTEVTILLTDGTKWKRYAKINVDVGNVDVSGEEFRYKTSVPLTNQDLVMFSTKTIKKYRLEAFDVELNPDMAIDFSKYVKCVMKAK